jgi:hypothetical protein
MFWAAFFERSLNGPQRPADIAKNAALTAAGAAAFDYLLMPRRLQPGFEANLSSRSMVSAFISIGAGLAAGRLLFDAISRARSADTANADAVAEPGEAAVASRAAVPQGALDKAVL